MAVVAFVIAIVATLAGSWVIGFAALAPNPSTMPDADYLQLGTDGEWYPVTFGPPVTQDEYDERQKQRKPGDLPTIPVGARIMTIPDGVTADYSKAPKARIVMPDGNTREFAHPTDGEIAKAWHKSLHKVIFKQWILSIGLAVVLALALSYMLQSLYRALLYVIYGSRKEPSLTG